MLLDVGRLTKALENSHFGLDLDTAYALAYHLHDAFEEFEEFLKKMERADSLSDEEVASEVYDVLFHAPDHINAASFLLEIPRTDFFNLGLEIIPEPLLPDQRESES